MNSCVQPHTFYVYIFLCKLLCLSFILTYAKCIRLSVHAKRFIFLIIKNKLDVTTQLHEEIIINQNVATIFTPRIDKATILCNHLPAETSILNVGINFIQQYANCTIATSEFKTTNEAIQITPAIFLMLLVFSFCRFCCTPCGAYTLKCLPKKCIKTTCYSIVICLERMHLA